MKKLFILVFIISSFQALSQTGVYHPFPEDNASWNFHLFVMSIPPPYYEEDYTIQFAGDTVINSHTYHRLHSPTNYDLGAIRQDISARKVFYVSPFDSTEMLLYDFTMEVGDTLQGYIGSGTFSTDTVISIDSVLVGNQYHKRWFINSWYGIYFIEGVGSTYGLIERSPGQVVDGPSYTMLCFSQNGQTLYPDTLTNCDIITSVNEKAGPSVNIFPNPCHQVIHIDCPDQKFEKVTLLDMTGKIVYQVGFEDQLDLSAFPVGIYLLKIHFSDGTVSSKKVLKF